MRRSDAARLLALSAIWGSSFIFIRVIAPVLGPVLTVVSRVLIGGAVLVAYCRIIGLDAEVARHWRQYAVIGVVNSTLPFMLFAFAALHHSRVVLGHSQFDGAALHRAAGGPVARRAADARQKSRACSSARRESRS